ncbi:FecR family protein [Nostoc favosum]|uniref:FecR family protein n=1 Tax=Nostoc favosum CHAB5714 TaxID=2780399 RepID=A0ABS8I1N6_9NOSO|nr:FecR family protein [Nostoc favosum]MCC5598128.1 FecR family protein [Nostoc favosum CHAB5714]
MFYKSFPLLVIALWGVIVVPLPNKVSAITPLTRAEIQNLRNMVQLIPKDKLKKRPARKLDAITPGDGLSTGQASLADLRFNDGSLARVGEQALFQFLPKTRDFKLSNGTVLLLIPPGRGQTRIQTPSAAAAIRGSALFVRYDQQTDTTIVGALTNSGIEVSNKEGETKVLEAGQMIILIKGKFQNLYDFDLRNFYETSELVRELDLNRQSPVPTPDPAITSVQAETTAALEAQPPIKGEGVIENPSFVQLTPSPSNSPSSNDVIKDNSSANSSDSEKTGQASTNTNQQSVPSSKVNTEDSNVGVDSSRTPTIPQTSPIEKPTSQNTQNTPQPAVGGTVTPPPETRTPPPETTTPPPETRTPPPETRTPPPETRTPPSETRTPPSETTTPPPETTTPPPETTTPPPETTTPPPETTTPPPETTTPPPETTTPPDPLETT